MLVKIYCGSYSPCEKQEAAINTYYFDTLPYSKFRFQVKSNGRRISLLYAIRSKYCDSDNTLTRLTVESSLLNFTKAHKTPEYL